MVWAAPKQGMSPGKSNGVWGRQPEAEIQPRKEQRGCGGASPHEAGCRGRIPRKPPLGEGVGGRGQLHLFLVLLDFMQQ